MNLSGLFYSMKYEVPPILAAGGGAIVNVSSVFADRGGPRHRVAAAGGGAVSGPGVRDAGACVAHGSCGEAVRSAGV